MKFTNLYNRDFQKERAFRKNTPVGNIIMTTTEMPYFDFETLDGVSISGEDFYLQKIDYVNGSWQFTDYLQLDNTYKIVGLTKLNNDYFESYEFASEIEPGCYAIRAGNYQGLDLFRAIDVDITDVSDLVKMADANGDFFGDANGDFFGELK